MKAIYFLFFPFIFPFGSSLEDALSFVMPLILEYFSFFFPFSSFFYSLDITSALSTSSYSWIVQYYSIIALLLYGTRASYNSQIRDENGWILYYLYPNFK
jgi:hypothetical protein